MKKFDIVGCYDIVIGRFRGEPKNDITVCFRIPFTGYMKDCNLFQDT